MRAGLRQGLLLHTHATSTITTHSHDHARRSTSRTITTHSRDLDYYYTLTRPCAQVYVKVPLDVAESRDPKGLYKKARSGALKGFTGIDAPYEVSVSVFLSVSVPVCVSVSVSGCRCVCACVCVGGVSV